MSRKKKVIKKRPKGSKIVGRLFEEFGKLNAKVDRIEKRTRPRKSRRGESGGSFLGGLFGEEE